ncbi:ribonuclease HIII [Bacillus canaveralius]|uniref:Ribonuclease HIII n=1 Tax=Bacillus canaveralius TaxID=1403243 RepID=A0A2N5GJR1_9BACI|nr:ribonuclease HIII [Bacillus canaveralius]PLR81513.1 ribonuclease HIII [Bacillus canaveralius]PLR93897.1 ribonuclease HIII [Bacillus canaveralius]RSK52519.1 ribonuclease HIII [Bacillus canaveralius]
MSNVVLNKKEAEIYEMKIHYNRSISDKTPPGSIFSAKIPGCTITAYKSGKVLFQGPESEREASKWGEAAPKKEQKTVKAAGSHLPANFANLSVIGSDEVGTGDYFGPITVVAAYVRKEDMPALKDLGVRDSKNLNDAKISMIAKELIKLIPYRLLVLKNDKYNKYQQSGMSQGKIKALLHNQAIGQLLEKIAPEQPEAILIDQFAEEKVYYQHLKGQQKVQKERVFFSTKAEGIHLSVAAASIIARYAFVRCFEELSDAAGFTLPKGAGALVDQAGARLINEKGIESLPQFAKMHFANTEKAIRIRKQN